MCLFRIIEPIMPYLKPTQNIKPQEDFVPSPSEVRSRLVVRNAPARYTKKKIMQEWPPDGTYNFMIVEAYNFKERNQTGDDVKLQPQRNCGFLSSLA